MPNRIGVDLDNTILSYEKLFHRLALESNWIDDSCLESKESIKSGLRDNCENPDLGEKRWQQLQAWGYGDRIDEAEIFHGFKEFVMNARARQDDMFIVSHKTSYSNFDSSVNLRKAAYKTLEKRGFFHSLNEEGLGFTKGHIFFVSTLEEKLVQIDQLGLSHFIDDLPKVLLHQQFPKNVRRIGFGDFAEFSSKFLTLNSWKDIDSYFSLCAQLENLFSDKVVSLSRIPKSGNNRINFVKLNNGMSCVVKEYLSIEGQALSRQEIEFNNLKFLWDLGIKNIPEPLAQHPDFAVYSFVEGSPIKSVGKSEMRPLMDLIMQFARISPDDYNISGASDCRFCLRDYVDVIKSRWDRILKGIQGLPWEKEVSYFLNQDVFPLRLDIEKRFWDYVDLHCLDLDETRSSKELIFSPSDFGFHNILKKSNGDLVFLDFEYSGWDDPAKLIADFFHHVAQEVPWDLKWNLLDWVACQQNQDPKFLVRWEGIIDLIGLEWVLIVLNVASKDEMERKQFSNPQLIPAELMSHRLNKAKNMIRKMHQNLNQDERFITIPSREKISA